MFICPVCSKPYEDEKEFVKHYHYCWKHEHPYQKSKEAPHSADIETRLVSEDIQQFFERKGK